MCVCARACVCGGHGGVCGRGDGTLGATSLSIEYLRTCRRLALRHLFYFCFCHYHYLQQQRCLHSRRRWYCGSPARVRAARRRRRSAPEALGRVGGDRTRETGPRPGARQNGPVPGPGPAENCRSRHRAVTGHRDPAAAAPLQAQLNSKPPPRLAAPRRACLRPPIHPLQPPSRPTSLRVRLRRSLGPPGPAPAALRQRTLGGGGGADAPR